VLQVAPGTQCPAGGEEIQVGIDTNGDGVLEANEVQHTAFVCNGVSAAADASAPTTHRRRPMAPGRSSLPKSSR
jgi:hypothetical protein